jgi:hypothetical protein
MKIQLTDMIEEYVIETIDLSAYDIEDDEDIELLKNDFAEVIINYVEENI